jgi:hypothetical protein
MTPKKSTPTNYSAGPAIKPSSKLLNWLNEQATVSDSRKRFRLPILIRFEDPYRLAICEAFIGAADTDVDKDTIFLSLDDTGMSMSLMSILEDICPQETDACAVWLEGFWGPLLKSDEAESEAKEDNWPFAVLKVDGLQKQDDGKLTAFIQT